MSDQLRRFFEQAVQIKCCQWREKHRHECILIGIFPDASKAGRQIIKLAVSPYGRNDSDFESACNSLCRDILSAVRVFTDQPVMTQLFTGSTYFGE